MKFVAMNSYNALQSAESQLKFVMNISLRKILGFLGGDYEEWRLLGCYAV
jgi:hypothetical protein